MSNNEQNIHSKYAANRQEFKIITCACRPYQTIKESDTPDWCPLYIIKIQEKVNEF